MALREGDGAGGEEPGTAARPPAIDQEPEMSSAGNWAEIMAR